MSEYEIIKNEILTKYKSLSNNGKTVKVNIGGNLSLVIEVANDLISEGLINAQVKQYYNEVSLIF
ncbi:hypothetical protein DS832_07910 [Bombilactobacillus bombi]|uniref:Uncharacterized protein n=1 Tax=Bombilactobacillus bombi TaxID=1303590 RepID=A0A417Z3M7_9LACO|nr:hypothetical protein [Bombilactobacillus bombi]RHW45289.1 hypothetical protein DS832_07910 [Bombilactobacillus bombi]